MDDLLFCRTKVYDKDPDCQLTQPKPDITLCFKAICTADPKGHKDKKCFDREILDGLRQYQGVLSSPFSDNHNACFPWAIYEGKASGRRTTPFVESQAANAAVKCLKMLENLPMLSGLRTPPIPCFTCKSESWELWICYRSGDDTYVCNNVAPDYICVADGLDL